MITKYGYPDHVWKQARAEIRSILIECARRGKTVYYSELVKNIRAAEFDPGSSALASILGEISTAEDAQGRGLLSAVVISKTGDHAGRPGPGFFSLARERGKQFRNEEAFWIAEFERVCDYWRQTRDPG